MDFVSFLDILYQAGPLKTMFSRVQCVVACGRLEVARGLFIVITH